MALVFFNSFNKITCYSDVIKRSLFVCQYVDEVLFHFLQDPETLQRRAGKFRMTFLHFFVIK